jgi:hypothetical protein
MRIIADDLLIELVIALAGSRRIFFDTEIILIKNSHVIKNNRLLRFGHRGILHGLLIVRLYNITPPVSTHQPAKGINITIVCFAKKGSKCLPIYKNRVLTLRKDDGVCAEKEEER